MIIIGLGGGGHQINPPGSILNAELIAIEAGFKFWIDKGKGNIKIFSDSLEAIHVLRTDQDHFGIEEDCINRPKNLLSKGDILLS